MRTILVSAVVMLGLGCGVFPCVSEPTAPLEPVQYSLCRDQSEALEVGVPFEIRFSPRSYGTCQVNAQPDAGVIELVVVEPNPRANCGWPNASPQALRLPTTCRVPGLPAGTYAVTLSGTTNRLTVPSSASDAGFPVCTSE